MLTQAIKRWFHRMFAWWPRQHSTEITYVEAAAASYRESTQGTIFQATIEGTTNQSSSNPTQPKKGELTTEQYILPPIMNEVPETNRHSMSPAEKIAEPGQENQSSLSEQAKIRSLSRLTSNQEQRLEFLYYLVKNGIVNEGFEPEDRPEQYRLH